MKDLIDPLVRALVAGSQDDVHFILESRRSRGGSAGLFTLGKPAIRYSYSTLVNDAVAEASYRVLMACVQEHGEDFPGFEMLLELENGRWSVDMHNLNDGDDNWAGLPRFPLRLVGHGYSLAPPPGKVFRWSQLTDPTGILAAMRNDRDERERAELRFASSGNVDIKVNPPEVDWQKLVELCEGPHLDEWWVEVRGFRFVWPAGVDMRYPVATGKQVELLGRDDSLMWIQGPVKTGVVDMNDMGSPDQRECGRGPHWVEFAYAAEGKNWRQRHHLKDCGRERQVVLTAQGPQECAHEIFAAAAKVYESLLPPTF